MPKPEETFLEAAYNDATENEDVVVEDNVETNEGDENTDSSSEGKKEEQVPYERFQEVNTKFRDSEARVQALEGEAKALRAEASQIEQNKAPEKAPEFQSTDDLIEFQDKKVDEKIFKDANARDAAWASKFEAQNQLNELAVDFPEIKEDQVFSNMVADKLHSRPNQDIRVVAEEVREYFKGYEEKGAKAAEKKFLEKSSFQGGVSGNQPMVQSDADRDYAKSIVDLGAGTDSEF